jgi:hypothetical protein
MAAAAMLSVAPFAHAGIYSNLATPIGTTHVLVGAGEASGPEIGNQVLIDGTQRVVNGMAVMVHAGGPGIAEFNGRVRLYAGAPGDAGTPFWDSQPVRFVIDSSDDLLCNFYVPRVSVPDSFTWTIEITDRIGRSQSSLDLPHYGPPENGAVVAGYWVHGAAGWSLISGEPAFGAGAFPPDNHCCSADFNNDLEFAGDSDIEDFFKCLAGNCCLTCNSADFNCDGDEATDADIELFFSCLAGNCCP